MSKRKGIEEVGDLMNDNDAFSVIIEWMIAESSNKEYIEKLNVILYGIKGKKNIEEHDHPRFQSHILFGFNIFPFSIKAYRQIAELLKDSSKNEQSIIQQGRQQE